MNGAALRCHREALGLPVACAAELLGITTYKLQQFEMLDHPVPSEVGHRLALIIAESIKMLDKLVSQDPAEPVLTFRSHVALWTHHPETDHLFPVSWHRIIAARAAAMTGRSIAYYTHN